MTPLGIEPVTYQLVARCLNQLRHRMPQCVQWLFNFGHPFPLLQELQSSFYELQINVPTDVTNYYLYFLCLLSPYMFRAFTGPSSGVS
jgi:hypothetical protein